MVLVRLAHVVFIVVAIIILIITQDDLRVDSAWARVQALEGSLLESAACSLGLALLRKDEDHALLLAAVALGLALQTVIALPSLYLVQGLEEREARALLL